MAKKFSELVFYPNAKKGKPEESEGTLDLKNGMPSTVKEEKKSDGMEIKHKSGRTETAKVHVTGSDYHIVKTKHGAQYTVDKKGNVLHGHGNTNEGYNDNRTGFAKKRREDDEYHTPDPTTRTHKIGFHVSKDGGEKHHRTVTISNSTKSKEEATATAKAHLEKQGYKIHEEVEIEESSKEDSLKHAPVAPTIPRKYIRGTPEHKAYKASKAPRTRMPTGKYNEEVELDEGVDPSEVASNPRMYNAETAKKAYYHKSASASDKESLAKHLDRHHGNKNWRKPVKEDLDESMTDSWKSVQAMDKGSLTGGKEEAKKHLTYLKAVHAHHTKFGNDTKKVKDKIERINRSRIAEETISEGAYEKAEENKKSADAAKKQGDMFAHHLHMADHHDNMAQWHAEKGRHGEADRHAQKSEEHHEKAMSLKEEVGLDEKMNLAKADMGDVIKDFQKSDAPQFAGKSDEKKRQMAIAAKLQADRETKKEEVMLNFTAFVEALKGNQHKIDKNKNGKVDAHDFKLLRKEEVEIDEGADPQVHVYSGKKHLGTMKLSAANKEHGTNISNRDVGMGSHGIDTRVGSSSRLAHHPDPKAREVRYVHASHAIKEEAEQIEEARINGREYASHGLMHPDHAKLPIHKAGGPHVDFYATKTGDKMQGKVLKNDGKEVHIKAHSDKELGDGKLHKFKVTANLPTKTNEEVEIEENAFDWKAKKSAPSSGRYEIKRENGRTIVTRKYNPDTGHSTGTDDAEPDAPKRGRGRPAGSKNRGSAK